MPDRRSVGIVPGFSAIEYNVTVASPLFWTPDDVRRLLSPARFDRYAEVAGSGSGAVELYEFNTQLTGAWHETLGGLEVVLRNALDAQLVIFHRQVLAGSGRWYADERMPWRSPKLTAQLVDARRRAQLGGRPESHGKVIAELTFGFWRYILAGTYQGTLWSPALRHAFPHQPTRDRRAVYNPVNQLHVLRNRVAHHEPIHGVDHSRLHTELVNLAGWIDPVAAAWINTMSRVPEVLEQQNNRNVRADEVRAALSAGEDSGNFGAV